VIDPASPSLPDAAASPCYEAKLTAAERCSAAERLAAAQLRADEQLRHARRQRAALSASAEDVRLGDRRELANAKAEAQQAYRARYQHARDSAAVLAATSTWLGEVSRLNTVARRAAGAVADLDQRRRELDAQVDRLTLAADAARVAAESARLACRDARQALAACEEAHTSGSVSAALAVATAGPRPPAPANAAPPSSGTVRRRLPPPPPPSAASPSTGTILCRLPPPPPADALPAARIAHLERAPAANPLDGAGAGEPPLVALLRGDRNVLGTVVSRLAEEIGVDAGRLQLLMLDLRQAIFDSALAACIFDFPPSHPFWSQFNLVDGRAIAAGLATLGRRFDGQQGWVNGRPPSAREVALAESLAGHDPRSVRRQPTAGELERLWQGTTVAAAEHVLRGAPDLRLQAVVALVGQRADGLEELWDNWGRLRPLLIGSG
jgi:hypothetical protein